MKSDFLKQQMQVYEAIKDTPVIDELNHESDLEYIVCSAEDVINPIVEDNQIIVVAGAYFGDEGKGKITDAVARHPDIKIIARLNSGENAGHTVVNDGLKYVFHLTPSGILVPGKTNIIGPECVMDPISYFQKEIRQLLHNGIDYKNKLFIGNVHIVGPHHKILDAALSRNNSSTLMGMAYVHQSKVRKLGLRLDDLFNPGGKTEEKLEKDLDLYSALIEHAGKSKEHILSQLNELKKKKNIPQYLFDFVEAKDKVDFILSLYDEEVVDNEHFPERRDVIHMLRESLRDGGKALFESPQSYWLSNATEKHWGSSTSAQTHANGVIASSGINISKYKHSVINVAKTPCDSRVGIGANPSSFVPQDYFSRQGIETLDDERIKSASLDFDTIQRMYFNSITENGILVPIKFKDANGLEFLISEAMAIASSIEFKEKGSTTNKPRITGLFDCVAETQVNEEQGPYLAISAMDRGDKLDNVGMTVAYIFHNPSGIAIDSNGIKYENGHIIKINEPYPCDNVLQYCHPIVKVMKGWKNTPINFEERNPNDQLPKNVQRFIGEIEHFTGFTAIGIGNGVDTNNMIYFRRK